MFDSVVKDLFQQNRLLFQLGSKFYNSTSRIFESRPNKKSATISNAVDCCKIGQSCQILLIF